MVINEDNPETILIVHISRVIGKIHKLYGIELEFEKVQRMQDIIADGVLEIIKELDVKKK